MLDARTACFDLFASVAALVNVLDIVGDLYDSRASSANGVEIRITLCNKRWLRRSLMMLYDMVGDELDKTNISADIYPTKWKLIIYMSCPIL